MVAAEGSSGALVDVWAGDAGPTVGLISTEAGELESTRVMVLHVFAAMASACSLLLAPAEEGSTASLETSSPPPASRCRFIFTAPKGGEASCGAGEAVGESLRLGEATWACPLAWREARAEAATSQEVKEEDAKDGLSIEGEEVVLGESTGSRGEATAVSAPACWLVEKVSLWPLALAWITCA